MRTIQLLQPAKISFGQGCASECSIDLAEAGCRRAFFLASPQTAPFAEQLRPGFETSGIAVEVYDGITGEPTVADLRKVMAQADSFAPDAVVGVGGGSVLDAAKLVAALAGTGGDVTAFFGIGLLKQRRARLACLPTTAGTGSEVSPNAILLSESGAKQGVISRCLVPDAAYVDPLLTVSMPPAVTAATGLDALAHCMEAYTNRFAHPTVDTYAFEGMRLIAAHLPRAVANGSDLEARECVALGSLYGGLCLGPVNTAAVHALAYPLGGEFHVPHGLSIAVLMAPVMDYNIPSAVDRYAQVAAALGVAPKGDAAETAQQGVEKVRGLLRSCGIDPRLSALAIPESAIPGMAAAAMAVTRLLKNNPREMTAEAAQAIYRSVYN